MSVYLDYNATTPVDPRVLEEMLPYFSERVGNAASVDHDAGNEARVAVERARSDVAALIGAEPDEIVFTSGATEANNIAILGRMERAGPDATLVVSAIEHPSVLETARHFGDDRVTVVPVDADGVVDPAAIEAAISPTTALVSVMTANNETGAIQPIAAIGEVCATAEVPFHTDAVQAVGRLPLSVEGAGASLLSLSSHKMYGPKGAGALYVRRRHPRARLRPVLWGGGHERGLRPGTINVPGVVGLGMAARVAAEQSFDADRQRGLRDALAETLSAELGGVALTTTADRLPQTLSVRIDGVEGRALMRLLNGKVALATGSACSTTSVDPSHVLLAQGLTSSLAGQTLRISLGRFTTADDITMAADEIVAASRRLRDVARTFAA